jgi:hypothetical protein
MKEQRPGDHPARGAGALAGFIPTSGHDMPATFRCQPHVP